MVSKIKKLIKAGMKKAEIKKEYRNDCREYIQYNYNNPKIKTQNALEAKILRQTHVIEKGMSLSNPRVGFGVDKAKVLLSYIQEFVNNGYSVDESSAAKNAVRVVNAYVNFHLGRGFEPVEIISDLEKFKTYIITDANDEYGIVKTDKKTIMQKAHSEFPEFYASRHSVRQFSDEPVLVDDIKKCVALALRAPSACNRQSFKAYFYKSEEINKSLGELIAGNTGFDNEVKNYIVVTGDISAFYDSFERNQMYVDGGIFALSLVESLHYYGIASCILQNGEYKGKNKKIRAVCGNIPENEKIILFIAVGYYKDEFTYAVSHRKEIDEILKVK